MLFSFENPDPLGGCTSKTPFNRRRKWAFALVRIFLVDVFQNFGIVKGHRLNTISEH